jgi:hypothetical protein
LGRRNPPGDRVGFGMTRVLVDVVVISHISARVTMTVNL